MTWSVPTATESELIGSNLVLTMLKPFAALFLMLTFGCNCSSFGQQLLDYEAGQRRVMQDQTVQLEMQLAVRKLGPLEAMAAIWGEKPGPEAGQAGTLTLSCSGVVVAKTDGLFSEPKTLIATANHCLDLPNVGDVTEEGFVVDAILITAMDSMGKTCELETIKLGVSDTRDVATAKAKCDLGKVAKMADKVSDRGEEVTVSGHPKGVYPGILTKGFVSGWMNGYLLISATAWGGNSGGPVFNTEGQVIGLLVRGSREYPAISLVEPLDELLLRIEESQGWSRK